MIGRQEIFTSEKEITSENIISVLQNAMPYHETNRARIEYLLNFEAGAQPLQQKKVTRTEIDCQTVDNVAHEICKFWRAYFWGQPITLVQRGEKDSGESNKDEADGIALLNECYEAEGVQSKTQKMGRFVEPTGIGIAYVDIKGDRQDGDSYFQYEVLDPRYAFVIKSSYYIDHRPMVGVSYRMDDNGSRHYTAITKDWRFEIDELAVITNGKVKKSKDKPTSEWSENSALGEKNRYGIINIIEYIRSHDRTGCFEHEIDDMNDLNLNESNFSNSVAENVNTVWWTNDVDLKGIVKNEDGSETTVDIKPKDGDWLHTFTPPDGKTPIVQPLTTPFDHTGMMNYILNKRALILQKCNVPREYDSAGGGSTGIAMADAAGWSAAEIVASMQQQIVSSCKENEIKVVLAVLRNSPDVPADSPLLKLRYVDIEVNMKRSKQYEMTTKLNAYATGVSHGIAPEHMIKEIGFFGDPQQVIEDSKPFMERYLKSIYEGKTTEDDSENPNDTEGRNSQDESDQIQNSPNLDSMKIGTSED